MLKKNFLLEKLKNTNEICIGTWSVIPSPVLTDVLCSADLDFIIIDSEHGPIGFEIAQKMAIACESQGVSPVMRVPGVNQESILKALEIGMHGIQVPNIESQEQVERLQQYSKYPPLGNRGFSPFTRACGFSSDFSKDMVSRANTNTLVNIHIEGKAGIENVDAILENDFIDVFFLGLFDISNYLGRPGEIDHPEILELFKLLTSKIIAAGKVVGSISNSIDQLNFLMDNNVQYITHSVDCHMICQAYQKIISTARGKEVK
jgi:4-hydroxy-2-oxoheptanedioate aldolase